MLRLRFSVASQVNGASDVEARLSGQNYLHLSNMASLSSVLPLSCRLLKSADLPVLNSLETAHFDCINNVL